MSSNDRRRIALQAVSLVRANDKYAMLRAMRRVVAGLAVAALTAACGAIPDAQRDARAPIRRSTMVFTPRADAGRCLAKLSTTKAMFSPLPDQYYGAGCATLNTVRLASLRSDQANLALGNLGPVACPLAETFAAWARFGADRAAQQILGSPLVKIETMGSYNCRNVAGSDRRSAHATANAIDISGFVLADGRHITIKGNWTEGTPAERRFLATVHTSACKRFGTVLGPAYNAAHTDHLHLELSGKAFCH